MKKIDISNKTILISRTDSIGDVVLTLPTCAWLKETFPNCKIIFLGRSYTEPILKCFPVIDEILDWSEIEKKSQTEQIALIKSYNIDTCIHVFPKKEIARLMKKAKVKNRIGTSHRLFHLTTCNIRPNFTRKRSPYHEAQLNFELLKPFGLNELPTIQQLEDWLTSFSSKYPLPDNLNTLLATSNKKVILHPKSQGSAVEWPIEHYVQLAKRLVEQDYTVFFSGTEKEGKLFRKDLPNHTDIIDISGKSSLEEFISFISKCDALVACSTGPLHIAATLGIKAIGLYTDLRPMHPGRWSPIGKKAIALTKGNQENPKLEDIRDIEVEEVYQRILKD